MEPYRFLVAGSASSIELNSNEYVMGKFFH